MSEFTEVFLWVVLVCCVIYCGGFVFEFVRGFIEGLLGGDDDE